MSTTITIRGSTFQQRFRKCGKPDCHCATGTEHGPYWYKQSKGEPLAYVGKLLPAAVLVYLEDLAAEQDNLKTTLKKLRQDEADADSALRHIVGNRRTIESLLAGEFTNADNLHDLALDKFALLV